MVAPYAEWMAMDALVSAPMVVWRVSSRIGELPKLRALPTCAGSIAERVIPAPNARGRTQVGPATACGEPSRLEEFCFAGTETTVLEFMKSSSGNDFSG